MDIQKLSDRFSVRRLQTGDVERIYELSCGNEIFYRYHPPFVTRESILDDMSALPPGKSPEDKYYVGFFEEDAIVAVMDLILAYPEAETAFIGFFMMHPAYQSRGIGSEIVEEVCAQLRQVGFQKIRLGVDKGNPQSFSFWSKNSFVTVDEKAYIVMERTL